MVHGPRSSCRNLIDRAIRIALDARAPDLRHHPRGRAGARIRSRPAHEFKWCPSSVGIATPRVAPDERARAGGRRPQRRRARWRCSSAQGARGAPAEVEQVADLLGAGVAKALLGKDVLPDDLPYVTGSIGLLGTTASYELMRAATRC